MRGTLPKPSAPRIERLRMKYLEILDPAGFRDDEICARCKFPGSHHRPPATFSYAKTGGSSGKARELPIEARTCNWTDTMTTCPAFCRAIPEGIPSAEDLGFVIDSQSEEEGDWPE